MKRSAPKRYKPLGADPEKVREFLRRGRQGLTRSPLDRPGAMRRASPAEGPLDPLAWREAVFRLSDGRCVMTGARARDAADRRFEAHHPLPKRVLRERGLLRYVWDPRNGVWLTRGAHRHHEDAFVRVPAEALPRSVWEFCAELDVLEGTQWATSLVLRHHPPTQEGSDGEGQDGRGDRDHASGD